MSTEDDPLEEVPEDSFDTGADECPSEHSTLLVRHVSTKQSPHMKAFHNHHPVYLTLDTGAEISMIKTSVATQIGAIVKKSTQNALLADGVTPLDIVGETRVTKG